MDRASREIGERTWRTPAAEPASQRAGGAGRMDLSARAAAQRDLVQLMRAGPATAARRQSLQGLFGAAAQLATTPTRLTPAAAAGVLDQVETRGMGQPLPAQLRASMERSFAADFSTVRVRQGQAAQALGARAYARGETLHFAPGAYDPGSEGGRGLIGHELAHVVQQREGRVAAPQGAGGIIAGDPTLEVEADRQGALAARGEIAREGASRPPAAEADGPRQGWLVVRGDQAQIDQMLVFLSQWARINLVHNAMTGRVLDGGDVELPDPAAPPWSLRLRGVLREIMQDGAHHANLTVGAQMVNTLLGGFPIPDDLTGADDSQRIDWAQISMVAAQSPANAAAILGHEIAENHEAHQYAPVQGISPMARAHDHGLTVESDISQQLGGGRRQGDSELDLGGGLKINCFDYETHFLVLGYREVQGAAHPLGGHDTHFQMRQVRRIPAVEVENHVIDMTHAVNDRLPQAVLDAARGVAQATIVVTHPELRLELLGHGIPAKRVRVRTAPLGQPERAIVRMPDHGELAALAQLVRQG